MMSEMEYTPDLTREQTQIREQRAARKAARKKMNAARELYNQQRIPNQPPQLLRNALSAYKKNRRLLAQTDIGEPDSETARTRSMSARAFSQPGAANRNQNRWVPIGPSVVISGQADRLPRVSGRVRDIAVSPNGKRAYIATAKGGVWYTRNAGLTWDPIGAWASDERSTGGNISTFSCGCLLVKFDNDVNSENDFVMVGTGEPSSGYTTAGFRGFRGIGVLVSNNAALANLQDDPWEEDAGLFVFEGESIMRMVRVPHALSGANAGELNDKVIAASSKGLILGNRVAGALSNRYQWVSINLPTAGLVAQAQHIQHHSSPDPGFIVTDVAFCGNRLYIAFFSRGLAMLDPSEFGNDFTTVNNAHYHWIPHMRLTTGSSDPAGSMMAGRISIAVNGTQNAVYALGEIWRTPAAKNKHRTPYVWRVNDAQAGASAGLTATPLRVASPGHFPSAKSLWDGQMNYDQCILVHSYEPGGAPGTNVDRVYIGGCIGQTNSGANLPGLTDWNGSVWAWDFNGTNLVAIPDVSATVPGGFGANVSGFIGNGIHPDIHKIAITQKAGTLRQDVWVGCDGGVFVSTRNGQANTFTSRNTGIASIESGFISSHPTNSQFMLMGTQDNGRQIRVGATVWQLRTGMEGDGGGVLIHPVYSNLHIGQYIEGTWDGRPTSQYRSPIRTTNTDAENKLSEFYSGIDVFRRPGTNNTRVALGTIRVWIADNVGNTHNTNWRVLPVTPPGTPLPTRYARAPDRGPGNNNARRFGVPLAPATIDTSTSLPLGAVVSVKWVNEHRLVAVYVEGIVLYDEDASGKWTARILSDRDAAVAATPTDGSVIPWTFNYADVAVVPGSNDFYVVGSGNVSPNPLNPTPMNRLDTCFYYADVGSKFYRTGLDLELLGFMDNPYDDTDSPVDPAYSVVVDTAAGNPVYVGTSTGVWKGTKSMITVGSGADAHDVPQWQWALFDNGLPESVAQDLKIWTDPTPGAATPTRLLRVALQSRGIWEVNLSAEEPVRTFLRVHAHDDRRQFPTPLADPRANPTSTTQTPLSVLNSPDIVVRPATPVTHAPSFIPGTSFAHSPYQLWTFQTALRWIYPSVVPNGKWSDQMSDIIARLTREHNAEIAGPPTNTITQAVWNWVMANAKDSSAQLAVYRPAWQNEVVENNPGTEADLMETVIPRRVVAGVWQIHREPVIVDVLLHHRDTNPVNVNESGVVLLWRSHSDQTHLLNVDCRSVIDFARAQFSAGAPTTLTHWNVALNGGNALHRLPVKLSARMPRSVEVRIDLGTDAPPSDAGGDVANPSPTVDQDYVLLLAIGGSQIDQFSAPTNLPAAGNVSVNDLVRNWPHAAARLIRVVNRPRQALF
ncbi:MAG: hypothetical protein OEZ43_07765 [Gammaproteobacteria bacterium]|nr:hypothetical protein [Gammaproteobacteria bacterium]